MPRSQRYVGDYDYDRGKTLQVVRAGDHRVAQPPDGLPAATLEAQSVPGKFAMRGANFVFGFFADEAGRIVGMEITRPGGTQHRLPRQIKKGEVVADGVKGGAAPRTGRAPSTPASTPSSRKEKVAPVEGRPPN